MTIAQGSEDSDENIEELKNIVQKNIELIEQHNSTAADSSKAIEGLRGLRQLLGNSLGAVDVVVSAGVVPIICNFLLVPSQDIQIEAAWCLTNIASGNTQQTNSILNAVPCLVQLLSSDPIQNRNLHNQVIWCLGNMAGDTDDTTRQIVVATGAISALSYILLANAENLLNGAAAADYNDNDIREDIDTTAIITAWALSNLSRGSTPYTAFTIPIDVNGEISTIIISLLILLNRAVALLMQKSIQPNINLDTPYLKKCLELVEELSWIFTFLSKKEQNNQEIYSLLLQHDLGTSLCNVCDLYVPGHPSSLPAIRALGNLTSGPIEWLECFMPSSSIPIASTTTINTATAVIPSPMIVTTITRSLSSSPNNSHRAVSKEALWVTANLLGGTQAHRDMTIMSSNLMEIIIVHLLCDQFDLQREAIFALMNAYKNHTFLLYIASRRDVLIKLIELLSAPDSEVVICCMSILRDVAMIAGAIELCTELGMMDVLDEIQYRSGNEDVRRLASGLSDEIFAQEDEDMIAVNNNNNDDNNNNEDHSYNDNNNDSSPSVVRGNKDAVKPAWMSSTSIGNNPQFGTVGTTNSGVFNF